MNNSKVEAPQTEQQLRAGTSVEQWPLYDPKEAEPHPAAGQPTGAIYREFERQLDRWHKHYLGRPKEEMDRLCLLALEREELVAVGYREEVMVKRLRAMPVSQEVRDVVRDAMLWIWADEEMHAVYIRGLILKLGSRTLQARAYAHQMAGAVGGWSSAVRQHVPWSDAPLSRAAASLIASIGFLAGKVPGEIREHLNYGPFRGFCLFNAETEQTARLCWWRLTELTRSEGTVSDVLIADFCRVQEDEERHAQVFSILAESFDDEDRLVDGVTVESMVRRIGQVGKFFTGRAWRAASRQHPIGRGGKVWVASGQSAQEKIPRFYRLLKDAKLDAAVEDRSKELAKPLERMHVVIKPAFMMGYDRNDTSVITDPELVDELAKYLYELGCGDVAVIEGRNIYDRFFGNRSVEQVANYFGMTSPYYRIIDATTEQMPHSYPRGMAQYTVARSWKEADLRITFGKMRSHPIELAHLAAGNVEWVGERSEEYIFPERQAERETAIMMLLDEFPPHFALLDAYDSAADGLVGIMGCPRPKVPRRLYASADALSLDIVAARHLHVKNPRHSSLLRTAMEWFGNPSSKIEVMGTDEPLKEWRDPSHSLLSAFLSLMAFPAYSFASGRGSLVVPEMDKEAFPPLHREWPLRMARSGITRLLGLHH